MYAADARATAAIRHHRSEQLRTTRRARTRQEHRLARLWVALTSPAGRLQAATPPDHAEAGQPAC